MRALQRTASAQGADQGIEDPLAGLREAVDNVSLEEKEPSCAEQPTPGGKNGI